MSQISARLRLRNVGMVDDFGVDSQRELWQSMMVWPASMNASSTPSCTLPLFRPRHACTEHHDGGQPVRDPIPHRPGGCRHTAAVPHIPPAEGSSGHCSHSCVRSTAATRNPFHVATFFGELGLIFSPLPVDRVPLLVAVDDCLCFPEGHAKVCAERLATNAVLDRKLRSLVLCPDDFQFLVFLSLMFRTVLPR